MAVLNEAPEFKGNESTTIGSICHHVYERKAKNIPVDYDDVKTQLVEFSKQRPDLELNVENVYSSAIQTSDAVLAQYFTNSIPGVEVEKEVLAEVSDGIYIGGHVDRLEDRRIVDFKNVNKKPDTQKIPLGYKLQLLSYAAALGVLGNPVDEISIVYGVKPTKTLGARCYVVTEKIEEEHTKLIEYVINLIICSINKCKIDPSLIPLIFKDLEVEKMY